VAALLEAGHEVRLLVRDPARIKPALAPHGGRQDVDHVVGDATDPEAVKRALAGCDAVLHAAAVYRLDPRAYGETRRTNAKAAEVVLNAAAAQGCDPIVHVSSTVATLRRGAIATPDSPLSDLRSPYVVSKVRSEATARALQEQGAPVVIVSPGGVYGPHDPGLSDMMRRLRDQLRGWYPFWPLGGTHAVDVRDVARVHAAVMKSGAGPRRYIVPGHFLDGATLYGTLREVTGRRLPYVPVPATMMLPVTWLASAVQRVVPVHLPAESEGVLLLREETRADTSRTESELGVTATPLRQTMSDAVRWLYQAGHISARQAGRTAVTAG